MAESTIPGAGWGVFASRTYQAGDVIVSFAHIHTTILRFVSTTKNVFGFLSHFTFESLAYTY
jgi:hypothetical protein